MRHYCLQTHEVVSSYTALNLADEIRNSMEEWEITDKVVMVITDIMTKISRMLLLKSCSYLT